MATCTKCGGSGKLDWTTQDGGICYKCEGNGYTGEMPEGFVKLQSNRLIQEQAEMLVKIGLSNLKHKTGFSYYPTYEFYPHTIQDLIAAGKVAFKFKYNPFWMSCPNMEMFFGGDKEYKYKLIVGGEFVEVRPVKI